MKRQSFANMLRNKPIFLALAFMLTTVFPVLAGSDTYTEQLTYARVFGGPLVPVGGVPPGEAESKELWEIAGDSHESTADMAVELQAFVKKYPKSPWTPSLEAHLAQYDLQTGYFTLALQN